VSTSLPSAENEFFRASLLCPPATCSILIINVACFHTSANILCGSVSFISFLQDGHDTDDPKQSTADMTAFVSSSITLRNYFIHFG
jgi:hypothetical protein